MIDKTKLSAELKAARLARGWTLHEVASRMVVRGWSNTTTTHIANWERGSLPSPWDKLRDLREVLGLAGDPPEVAG